MLCVMLYFEIVKYLSSEQFYSFHQQMQSYTFLFLCAVSVIACLFIALAKHHVDAPYECQTKCNKLNVNLTNQETIVDHNNYFGSCSEFYLDIGSNIGVQVRKLYEPEFYPGAPVLAVFDQYFGPPSTRKANKRLCAVGFEMNPHHTGRLKELQVAYNSCGYQTFFHTETAVAAYDGFIDFWTDSDDLNKEWGASTVHMWSHGGAVQVRAVNLGQFIQRHIIPYANIIVTKLDIEGQEVNVLPSLLSSGTLCRMDVIMSEYHDGMMNASERIDISIFKGSIEMTLKRSLCRTRVIEMDDESFARDDHSKDNACF